MIAAMEGTLHAAGYRLPDALSASPCSSQSVCLPAKQHVLSGAPHLSAHCHSVPRATQVVANGSCHSIEGIKLEELGLKTGEAKLLVRGNLLGAAQDATIILTDFPVAILQPVFRALPALEHAAPAVAASGDCRRHAAMPCCPPGISSPSAHCPG